ncbi:MAG TPA: laminin G [Halococcus sp.]|nr:laminin G [Halococcus sp.]
MTLSTSRTLAVVCCVLAIVTAPVLAVPTHTPDESQQVVLESNISDVSATVPLARSETSHQVSQSSKTITIRSTGEERAQYTITVSGRIEPASGADLTNADVPDSVTGSTATGSTAQGGTDNFTFTGRITALSVTGGPARVSVNGERIEPADFPATPIVPSTPTATRTPPPTSTATPTATPTQTATPTRTPQPTTQTPAPTPTPTQTTPRPSPTTASTPTESTTELPTTTSPPPQTTTGNQSAGGNPPSTGASGILGGVNTNTLVILFGIILIVIFSVAAIVARYNRSRPETALDSDSES